jgi:hypothetical protein
VLYPKCLICAFEPAPPASFWPNSQLLNVESDIGLRGQEYSSKQGEKIVRRRLYSAIQRGTSASEMFHASSPSRSQRRLTRTHKKISNVPHSTSATNALMLWAVHEPVAPMEDAQVVAAVCISPQRVAREEAQRVERSASACASVMGRMGAERGSTRKPRKIPYTYWRIMCALCQKSSARATYGGSAPNLGVRVIVRRRHRTGEKEGGHTYRGPRVQIES